MIEAKGGTTWRMQTEGVVIGKTIIMGITAIGTKMIVGITAGSKLTVGPTVV
jgi:hypothetical protein